MQSFRYKENRKAGSESRHEQPSATLYRKMLISWSSGFGIRISLYYNQVIRQALLWKKNIGIRRCRAWDTRKTVRQYQKEGMNNEARRCIGKCSYPGDRVSKFEFFYVTSKVISPALFGKKNIRIRRCTPIDTRKTVRQYQKEGRNNEARRCTGKCSYPGHGVWEFEFYHIE